MNSACNSQIGLPRVLHFRTGKDEKLAGLVAMSLQRARGRFNEVEQLVQPLDVSKMDCSAK